MSDESQRPRAEDPVPVKTVDQAVADMMHIFEPKAFPVYEKRDEVSGVIHNNDRIVIEANTGSGKSTVMPTIALAEIEGRIPGGKVVVTQPRRFAVKNLYTYLHDGDTKLHKQGMGDVVGFRHGGGRRLGPRTQLVYTVEQSLLNDIADDRSLSEYGTVILDEVHERTANLDILMPLLMEAQDKRKEQIRAAVAKGETPPEPLKLIMASGTINRAKMLEYFEGAVHEFVPGKNFEIEEFWETEKVEQDNLQAKAAEVAAQIHARGDEEPGDILIFMPGRWEIDKTIEALNQQQNLVDDGVEFIRLMGGKDSDESMRKTNEVSDKRRIFIATNVAETSVTIGTVRVVIDSGLAKLNIFDPLTGLTTLETGEHTKANAIQRKGRVGRTATGTVHYLFRKEDLEARDDFLSPEILRKDILAQVLLLKKMGIDDIQGFKFMDHPGEKKINDAIKVLRDLGALDSDGKINDVGREMAGIETEPRFARMIVEARRLGVEDAVTLIVGMLQDPQHDVFDRSFKNNVRIREKYKDFIIDGSDILTRLNIWNKYLENRGTREQLERWEAENGLDVRSLNTAAKTRQDILEDRNFPDLPIDLSPEAQAKITQSIAVGLIDKMLTKFRDKYQTAHGVAQVKLNDYASVLEGVHPDAMISAIIRRSKKGVVLAEMNFILTRQEFERLTEKMDVRWPPKVSVAPPVARPLETVSVPGAPVVVSQPFVNVEPTPPVLDIDSVTPVRKTLRDRIRSFFRR